MLAASGLGVLGGERPRRWTGVATLVAAVVLVTAAIYPLQQIAPVVALSVVYLPAVLLISAYWGLAFGLGSSLLSAAAFNFFHLPPTGRFTIADSRNWVALVAFTIVAVVASTIAELARSRAVEAERRRGEADLAAELARELLAGADTAHSLRTAARLLATALSLSSAAIELGAAAGDARRDAVALSDGDGQQLATLLVLSALPAESLGTPAHPSRPDARSDPGRRAAPGRAAGGCGDRCAAPLRRRQDGIATGHLARSPHAVDRNRRRRPRARDGFPDRGGAG